MIDVIILVLILFPLILGNIAFIKVTKNTFNVQKRTFISAILSEQIICIANFSSIIGLFFGINPIYFCLLIYIQYPIKYFFFSFSNKVSFFLNFYKNLKSYHYYVFLPIFCIVSFTSLILTFTYLFTYTYLLSLSKVSAL